ncbi:MAG: chorismate-binding protein, partial [Muribaculaceae bacterium]|nr:chorismate-binding protein [Muribaculaceae bacterium]
VQFKPVCHICDLFSGTLPAASCTALLDELSPTPALSGFPVATAIDEISLIEDHNRECYGGYVGYVTPSALKCYVNLRSVKLCDSGYCIFAGGGVTAQSNPEDEWNETENKTMVLRKNIAEAMVK